jgi:hypothetical protein
VVALLDKIEPEVVETRHALVECVASEGESGPRLDTEAVVAPGALAWDAGDGPHGRREEDLNSVVVTTTGPLCVDSKVRVES